MSTFHGLEMAKQAINTQRSALYTTGHNISNANTDGYTRQRVNFEANSPYPSASRNRPQIPGQIGTGVKVGSVERIRNQYLDHQFRAENSKAGYWEKISNAVGRMERIMNEPSENGLASTMDAFRGSLQELSSNPSNSGARAVAVNRALAVTDTFNYISNSLGTIRSDLKNEINIKTEEVNTLLKQINEVNKQIKQLEPHGYLANDLYDDRDRLIDSLSEIVNIKLHAEDSGEGALDIAEGPITIELVDENGKSFDSKVLLLDGETDNVEELSVEYSNEAVSSLHVGDQTISFNDTTGSLIGIIESYGYMENGQVEGIYPEVLTKLDKLAEAFGTVFNELHKEGYDLNGDNGGNLFEFTSGSGSAASITVSQEILDNPDLFAASADNTSGNGDHATLLAGLFDKDIDSLGENTTINSFYESLIGNDIGVRGQEAKRRAENAQNLRSQVENQRLSVSAVSLDEEMSNMIKFQHAYNAAARNMTTIDEMLDRIINSMGLVGR